MRKPQQIKASAPLSFQSFWASLSSFWLYYLHIYVTVQYQFTQNKDKDVSIVFIGAKKSVNSALS